MRPFYDVAVVGLGATGSATVYELGRRGARVVGLDRSRPPHRLGSSHGDSRIIREAYFEDSHYVPLVRLAYDAWRELESASGERLLLETGGLMIGPPDGVLVAGARNSAERHSLAYTLLSPAEVAARFPALRLPPAFVGLHEPRAGVLFPERANAALLALAEAAGVELRYDEPVVDWSGDGDGVELRTAAGNRYRAGQLVLAAGAWLGALVPELGLPLTVERQVQHYFAADRPELAPASCPVHLWEYVAGRFWYGFPVLNDRVKLAIHHQGEPTTATDVERAVRPAEVEALRALVAPFLPGAIGRWLDSEVCLYTNTPDGHFLIDRHPHHRQVLLASPCSGHGFKFAPVIGRALADQLLDGCTSLDLEPFQLRRLVAGDGAAHVSATPAPTD